MKQKYVLLMFKLGNKKKQLVEKLNGFSYGETYTMMFSVTPKGGHFKALLCSFVHRYVPYNFKCLYSGSD